MVKPSAQQKKPRKPRQTRNPERTRGNLLRAGVELFSKRGYDGVAVDAIVARAGCNKRMLYHYYGSKDGLYIEVLRDVFGRLEDREIVVLETELPTEAAIRNILDSYFRLLNDHPEFVNLLLWENLNGGRFLDAHPGLLSKSPVVRRLDQVLTRARKRGEITRAIDAKQLLVLLYGACFIHFSNRHTLRHTIGLGEDREAVLQAALTLAQDVITRGLLSPVK